METDRARIESEQFVPIRSWAADIAMMERLESRPTDALADSSQGLCRLGNTAIEEIVNQVEMRTKTTESPRGRWNREVGQR